MEHSGLKTPGGELRRARAAQDISLAEMSERTKIPPPVIEALEQDEYHKVSGALYIKSFLRTCAVELGLEAEEILALYAGMTGADRAPAGGEDMVWQEDEVQISRVGMPWRTIAVTGLALVLLGSGGLVLVRGCGADKAATPGSGPAVVAATGGADTVAAARRATGGADTVAAARRATSGADTVAAARRADAAEDTLAGGWSAQVDPAAEPAAATVAAPPTAAAPTPTPTVEEAPMPLVGGPGLVFAGGRQLPVVVRLIADRPLDVQFKRDANRDFTRVRWPAAGEAPPVLPATGIEPGRVYRVSRGLVIYWGAEDHLSLRLDRTDGVEVAVNGRVRSIRNLRPGGELLLDNQGE